MKIKSSILIENFCYENTCINYELIIKGISTINYVKEDTIVFVNKFNNELLEKVNNLEKVFILLKEEYKDKIKYKNNVYVFVENPRYEYARIVDFIRSSEEENCKL